MQKVLDCLPGTVNSTANERLESNSREQQSKQCAKAETKSQHVERTCSAEAKKTTVRMVCF